MLTAIIDLDFNSDEAIYMQLTNQIIMGIASSQLQAGDPLPSVRSLAGTIGINMHTVNKAYSLLRQWGYIQMDRRRGAVISVDTDRIKELERMREDLSMSIARGLCKNVTREDVHQLVDSIFDEYLEE